GDLKEATLLAGSLPDCGFHFVPCDAVHGTGSSVSVLSVCSWFHLRFLRKSCGLNAPNRRSGFMFATSARSAAAGGNSFSGGRGIGRVALRSFAGSVPLPDEKRWCGCGGGRAGRRLGE